MKFVKMHGIGNDFIVIDRINNKYDADFAELAKKYCDRHTGVAADGILLIEKSDKADAMMRLYNADGSEAEMCGNGIRCVAKYLQDNDMAGNPLTINTLAGIMAVEKINGNYRVDMGKPEIMSANTRINVNGKSYSGISVVAGNPNIVIFVHDFGFNWMKEGRIIEHDPQFPNRTNVEFVKVISPTELDAKIWERGAGATLACGTGACASLVAAVASKKAREKAVVHLIGGDLEVELKGGRAYMTGPAEAVFKGEIPP